MKRFSIGLAAVGLTASLGAYAALPTDAAPFQVNIPNIAPGFEFSATGLYLRPSDSNLDYAVVVNATTTVLSNPSYDVKAVDPTYNWGFGLMIGYVFPNSGNDARLAWTHLNTSDSSNIDITGYNNITTTVQLIAPLWSTGGTSGTAFDSEYDQASGNVDYKYDAIDLDAGQFVNFGTRLQVRLFGGLRYAHLKKELSSYIDDSTNVDIQYLNQYSESTYDGIGPRFGVDTSYHLGHCFGFVGHIAAAMLVGTVKTDTTITTPETTVSGSTVVFASNNVTTLNADDVTRVVPGVDAKIGLDWSYPFGNDSVFSAELGYQVTHYVDVFDTITPTQFDGAPFDYAGSLLVDSVSRTTSGVGFDGPYLTLSVKVQTLVKSEDILSRNVFHNH